jgi:hypothetical protein
MQPPFVARHFFCSDGARVAHRSRTATYTRHPAAAQWTAQQQRHLELDLLNWYVIFATSNIVQEDAEIILDAHGVGIDIPGIWAHTTVPQEFSSSIPQNQRALWTALERFGLLRSRDFYSYTMCACFKPFRAGSDVCVCGRPRLQPSDPGHKELQAVSFAEVARDLFAVPIIASHSTYGHDRIRDRFGTAKTTATPFGRSL